MATETLIFMPNGDVTLSLTRYVLKEDENSYRNLTNVSKPLDQTAPPDDGNLGSATDVEAELEALAAADEESVLFFAPDAPEIPDGPTSPPPPRARRGSNASSRRDRSESPPASFWATLKRQAARVAAPERPPTPLPAKKTERIILSSHEVHCVVSSRHLMLASRYFHTILGGDFPQAMTLRTGGHVTIPLQDDLDSMIILLNIIHGAGRKVPRQVSLDVLSKLAVLVSKFEMLSTVEFFSDTWIDNLQRGGLPKGYNENVLPLVFVFWVFDRPGEFRDMTRLAQRESTEKLEDDVGDMPILHGIIDAIKRDREFAIETAITVVQALIDRYMAGQAICDSALDDELRYACDSMVLGCLMSSSRKIGIWPKPVTPFNGKKFRDLVKAIRSIRILDVCNKTSSRRWNSHGPSPNCHGLEDSIEASMENIEAGLDGLKLEDYPKLSEDYSLILQASLPEPEPLVEVEKEQSKQDNHESLLVYTKEEITEPPKEETRVNRLEFSAPSANLSPRIESSKVTEYPRQEVSAPPPHFSPHFDLQKRVESPKPEVAGASSFFSARLNSQKAESFKPEVPAPSPSFTPVYTPKPTESIQPEVSAPSPRFWASSYAPDVADAPKQEPSAATYFYPRDEGQKAESPIQAPAPRFSPAIDYVQMAAYPRQVFTAPSPPPFGAQQAESPIQAPTPSFSPSITPPLVAQSPPTSKQEPVPSPPILASTNPFRTSEPQSPKTEFSASPRFSPQVSAPQPPSNSKPRLESPINGFGAALKEDARTFLREREKDQPAQEGVKVSPSPVTRGYSPSKEFLQSRVAVTPRTNTLGGEEMKRISTNSPPPAQKYRMLAKERGSDSEREAGERAPRAPSVISNLSIDEMLMDIPQPQPQSTKEARKTVVEVKGKGQKGNPNGNGNGSGYENPNVSQTTTETEDAWTPPKTFKMKKSKKTFSTRY